MREQRMRHGAVHMVAADMAPLCGAIDEPAWEPSKVTCHACLGEIRRLRTERLRAEAIQREINAILAHRKRKLESRIARKNERRR